MSDPVPSHPDSSGNKHMEPGELLRQARLNQGLTLDALAGILKVSSAKLEALEQGRHDSLPNAQFVRALAMTVCRYLKLDSAAVLAGLPAATPASLNSITPSLNQPFRDFRSTGPLFDRQGGLDLSRLLLRRKWVAPALLVLASLLVLLLPDRFEWPFSSGAGVSPSESAASQAAFPPDAFLPSAPSPTSSAAAPPVSVAAVVASVASLPASAVPDLAKVVPLAGSAEVRSEAANAAASRVSAVSPATSGAFAYSPLGASVPSLASSKPFSAGLSAAQPVTGPSARLQVKVTETSWVEVRDATGAVLLGRQIHVGEVVAVDGILPLKLNVGNASKVQMTFKGQPVDLGLHNKAEVARLELK